MMPTHYIKTDVKPLFNTIDGDTHDFEMIHGDEVDTVGDPNFNSKARIGCTYRGRAGFVQQDQLKPTPGLQAFFIDVGQGDSTFIITPAGRTILVDGGVNNQALGFLIWYYRLDKPDNSVDIDLLVLSHADADHLAGLVPIIRHPRINVRRIVDSGIATFDSSSLDTRLGKLDNTKKYLVTRHNNVAALDSSRLSSSFRTWRDAVLNEGCQYESVCSTSDDIDVGDPDVRIEVLGPYLTSLPGGKRGFRWYGAKKKPAETINGHSVLLRLVYGDTRFLLTGDLNTRAAKDLMKVADIKSRLSAHVLKAPHHGSAEFHPPFLEEVRPQVTVISSGDKPDYAHPRANFLAATGKASRSPEPLLFSTEIAATFKDVSDDPAEFPVQDLAPLDFGRSENNIYARRLFKQVLPGIINVRSDGTALFAARRYTGGWEYYGPAPAEPDPA